MRGRSHAAHDRVIANVFVAGFDPVGPGVPGGDPGSTGVRHRRGQATRSATVGSEEASARGCVAITTHPDASTR